MNLIPKEIDYRDLFNRFAKSAEVFDDDWIEGISLAGLTVHTAAQCTSGSLKTHGSAIPNVSNAKARVSGKSRNAYRSPFATNCVGARHVATHADCLVKKVQEVNGIAERGQVGARRMPPWSGP